jgi:hypothetical protein
MVTANETTAQLENEKDELQIIFENIDFDPGIIFQSVEEIEEWAECLKKATSLKEKTFFLTMINLGSRKIKNQLLKVI